MRFVETKKLNDYVTSVGGFFDEEIGADLPERLASLGSVSLQSFSIEHDRSFLRQVSAVLNVIVSIIYHPHISNKREEVIIRVEQAQQVSQEAFLDTLKDGKLWKKHDVRMIPEELHYHQYEDELRIYENRFIGFLVDVIDRELAKFSAFYLSRLPTLNLDGGELDSNEIGATIVEIDRLRRKTQFIKGTHFYKEVSRGKPISSKIQPTNILLKDRLYRFCFKFYRSIARYEDVSAAKSDLRAYYTLLLFGELCRCGFAAVASGDGEYVFEREDFFVTLRFTDKVTLEIETVCRTIEGATPCKHVLGFYVETEVRLGEGEISSEGYEGAEMISIWELCCADGGRLSDFRMGKEEELIREWLATKISKVAADRRVYRKYCPVCRSRGVEANGGVYACPACDSRYMFDTDGEADEVWFRRIRRR